MNRQSKHALTEVIGASLLFAAFLWIGPGAPNGVDAAFALALLALLFYSHRLRGEGLRDLGFRLDTFARAILLLLPVAFIGAALIVSAAFVLGDTQLPPIETGVRRTVRFIALGIVQQYVLVGFFFRRFETVVGFRWAPLVTALVFAVLHAPNVFLAAVTFPAGIVSCYIFRKAPNLWANGLIHGLLGSLLYHALPRSVTGGLRVGAEYIALALTK